MKIAFDLRRIKNPGIGRYMKCLVEAVLERAPENEYLLILPPDAPDAIESSHGNVRRITPRLKYYSIREQIELPRILRREKIDLLHSPHFNLPVVRPCPTVVTIHDVIYLTCPEDLPSRVGRLYYRAMMGASVRLADRIIAVSDFSKADIVRVLDAKAEKIQVVHSGIDPVFFQATDHQQVQAALARHGIAGEYILYAGIYKLRKNHAGLLRAFERFRSKGGDTKLVIAGPLNEGEVELRGLASSLGIASEVVFTGFVPSAELPALYSGARVYACPSLYEGFGFTVLEAMACGVPVVCSPKTSLPEVAGQAAIFADPLDADEFGEALRMAVTDEALRTDLIARGKRNVQRFSWSRAAEQTLAAYRGALGDFVPGVAHA